MGLGMCAFLRVSVVIAAAMFGFLADSAYGQSSTDAEVAPAPTSFELANRYETAGLVVDSVEAAQSFRGGALEPAAASATLPQDPNDVPMATAPEPAPPPSDSLVPRRSAEPIATGPPQVINSFGLH